MALFDGGAAATLAQGDLQCLNIAFGELGTSEISWRFLKQRRWRKPRTGGFSPPEYDSQGIEWAADPVPVGSVSMATGTIGSKRAWKNRR